VLAAINIAGPQIGHQQSFATHNIKWQVAMIVVMPMEIPAFLLAMNDAVGGIKVEDQAFWWMWK
jgi:hypothetical protein